VNSRAAVEFLLSPLWIPHPAMHKLLGALSNELLNLRPGRRVSQGIKAAWSGTWRLWGRQGFLALFHLDSLLPYTFRIERSNFVYAVASRSRSCKKNIP